MTCFYLALDSNFVIKNISMKTLSFLTILSRKSYQVILLVMVALTGCAQSKKSTAETQKLLDKLDAETGLAKATFAGGCFWCTEAIFEEIIGIREVVSGYSGGTQTNPSYEKVGAGLTSHAESFQVYYDPKLVSFSALVDVFFASIDPTIVNGQGPDRGEQYRTIAFYRNAEEKKIIEDKMKAVALDYDKPLATQVSPFEAFYPAEDYHQDFVKRNPNQGYVQSESLPRRKRTLQKVKHLLKNQ